MLEFVWSKAANQDVLKLKGDAIVNSIVVIYNSLKTELTKITNLNLDLSELTACDLTFLQLLCALHQSLMKKKGQLSIEKPPQCFLELFAEAGLGEWSLCDFKENKSCLVNDCKLALEKKE